MSPNILQH